MLRIYLLPSALEHHHKGHQDTTKNKLNSESFHQPENIDAYGTSVPHHDSEAYDLVIGSKVELLCKSNAYPGLVTGIIYLFSMLLFIYFRSTPLEFTSAITAHYFKYLQQYQILAMNRIQLGQLSLYTLCQWEESMR